jgi:hypothetical protein
LEYKSNSVPDGAAASVESSNWLATTPYKNGQIVILAGAPSNQAEVVRETFVSVMRSVSVTEP